MSLIDTSRDTSILKHGLYRVGTEQFQFKVDALRYASLTKKEISWDFNRTIFSEQAKKPRLDVSLLKMYSLRAQQIRDKYDYVILAYSGGVDSDTILRAFVDSHIKLDEVWVDFPFQFIEKTGYTLNYSISSSNNISEWFLVIKPELERLRTTNPEIKIHPSDASSKLELEDFEDTWTFTNDPKQYHQVKRFRYIHNYISPMLDAGKRVCIIMGVDKCVPSTTSTEYGFVFNDSACYNKQDYYEYFYWTPDMPELVVTQAHHVWDYLKKNIELYKKKARLMKQIPGSWRNRQLSFDEIITKTTYPTWDTNKFQTNKQSIILGDNLTQFYSQYTNEHFYQSWKRNFTELISSLDPSISFVDGKNYSSEIKPLVNFHAIGKHDGSYYPF